MEQAEKVIADERCRCGGQFMILKIKGEKIPRVMHKKPACEQYERLKGMDFVNWSRNSKEPETDTEHKPNRRQRRAEARGTRRGGRRSGPRAHPR